MAGTQSGDDDTGEDGVDEIQPQIYGVLSAPFLLASGTEPVGGGEPGQGGADDDVDDQHTDMTVDFGFVQQISIGNLVFRDLNDDGIFDLNTDTGVDGVTVELWANDGRIAPVGSLVTSNGGLYNFNVAPGSYYVRIPESQFQSGAALANLRSSTNAANPVAGADDDANENGLDNTVPNLAGVQTAAFTVRRARLRLRRTPRQAMEPTLTMRPMRNPISPSTSVLRRNLCMPATWSSRI